MVPSVRQLAERMGEGDIDERAKALEQLIHHGRESTPVLVDALKSDDKLVRSLAAQGLAAIRDPASADSLYAALSDEDGEVRAQAAGALTRMNDPRATEALVRTIDDFEDVLHAPYSLSAYHLIALGEKVLPIVAPLLDAKSPITRMRAAAVVRDVARKKMDAGEKRDELEKLLGKYDPQAEGDERSKVAQQIIRWIDTNCQAG